MSTTTKINPSNPPEMAASRRAIEHLLNEYGRVRKERDVANARLARFAETIQFLLEQLPQNEQQRLSEQFEKLRKGNITPSRGSETYGNVIALFQNSTRNEWSIPEIQSELAKAGATQEPKAIYNTIAYLAKVGRLKRIARGRYAIVDVGSGIELEGYDDGTTRTTEHDW